MKRFGCFKQPYIVLLALSFVLKLTCQAQGPTLPEYEKIQSLKNDSNKVLQLISLSMKHRTIDVDTALMFNSMAAALSKQIDYEKGTANACYHRSIILKNAGDLDSAIYYNGLASDIYKQIDEKRGIGNCNNLNGSLLRRKGLMASALEHHKKSLGIFSEINDSIGIAKTCNYIGIVFKDLAQYDSAVVYFLNLIRISEKIDYATGHISGLINTGQVFIELEEYSRAKSYLMRSAVINLALNDRINLARVYNKIGMVEYYQENMDSALHYFDMALHRYEQLELLQGVGRVNINIGNVFEWKGDYEAALKNYNSSKDLFEEINLKSGILDARINIAVVSEKQKNYYEALVQYDSCLYLAREINANDDLMKIYNNIYKTYMLLGNSDKALEFLVKHAYLKDSIFSLEKAELINDLELKYETEKKEARILSLNNQNLQKDLKLEKESYRKNMYLAGWGLFFLLSVFAVLFFLQRIKRNKQLSEHKLQKAEEEKRLMAAQALLEGQEEERFRISKELHDGVGVLLSTATLYMSGIELENTKDKEILKKAHKIVDDANLDVRKISKNLMPTVLALQGLEDALHDLIENVDYLPSKYGEFHVSGHPVTLSKPRELMVYRMVQEMISNTLKHANAEEVDLELQYTDKSLTIIYRDDGTGFNFEKELMKKSVGLKSIQSRVDYLKARMEFGNGFERGSMYTIVVPV